MSETANQEGDRPVESASFKPPAFGRLDYVLALLTALVAFALYLRTLAPGLLGGDSGEFQFAAWLGGYVHPTGYPLYLMLGWLWTHLLPLRDPAWRMNLLSALSGSAAVGLVYLLALRVEKATSIVHRPSSIVIPRAVSVFAALTFAVTPTFWSQAVVTEVYALNALFVAAVLLAAVTWARTRSRRDLYITAAIYGLSLAHHRTMLLLAPAILIYPWLVARRRASENLTLLPPSPTGRGGSSAPPSLAEPALSLSKGKGVGGLGQPEENLTPLPPSPTGRGGSSAPPSLRGKGVGGLGPIAPLLALVLAPLLLYAYIPLVAPHMPYTQITVGPGQTLQLYEPTLRGFIRYVSGQTFEAAIGTPATALARLGSVMSLLVAQVTWVGVALGLIGLLRLVWRNRPLLALTGLSLAAIAGFNLFYGIGDIYVFYIPAYLIWVIWMAVGLAAIGDTVKGRHSEGTTGRHGDTAKGGYGDTGKGRRGDTANVPAEDSPRLPISASPHLPVSPSPRPRVPASPRLILALAFCLVSLALPVCLLLTYFPQVDRSRDNSARTTWEAILAQPIPQGAILVTNDRDEMVPQWYLKYVEARRPDLLGVFPLIEPGPAWADAAAVTDQVLHSGRPGYWIKPMPGMEVKFASEPAAGQAEGSSVSLVRVLGPAASLPPERPATAVYGDALRLVGYDLDPAALVPGEPARITLHWQPLKQLDADYTTFVHVLDADGNKIAQSDHKPGGVYYPTSLWKPGETLVDSHTLVLPATLGRPPYVIVVGLYDSAADMRHLGGPTDVGRWGPGAESWILEAGASRRLQLPASNF